MAQTPTLAAPPTPDPIPAALRALHDEAVAEFSAGHHRRALPLLGRLALSLPLGHGLRPTVRGTLARAHLALGNVHAARRELDHALATEPDNPTFLGLQRLLGGPDVRVTPGSR